jgi:Mg-chelatase subunit ChlD
LIYYIISFNKNTKQQIGDKTMSKDLSKYDFIIAVDKSGSMAQAGTRGKSRWEEAQEATIALAAKAAQFDEDGITVIPFANTFSVYDNVTADKIAQVFTENEPNGGTNTSGVLTAIFDRYNANKKPFIAVVLTDGEPNNRGAVKTVIKSFADTLPDNGAGDTDEAGILFLQIGNDPSATAFLRELDDNLGAKFDIVDTKTTDEIENLTLTDALLQALEG